ncbi:contractile injection system tape measure protein [Polaribacter sp.]|uniref:contractile injection system tape measure protein n=1 Tax=Polaribacter sp. TaxID=1920175 RepID=UPI003EFA0339
MANVQPHIIEKVIVDVTTKNKEVAFQIKDFINVFLKEEVFPSLEQYFESLESEFQGQTIQISKLNIDVNSTSDHNFRALKEDLKKQAIKELKRVIKSSEKDNENIRFLQVDKSEERALIYFLEKGIPPWWNASKEMSFLQEKRLQEFFVSPSFIKIFRDKITKESVQNRLINQFLDKEIKTLLESTFKIENVKISILQKAIVEKFIDLTPTVRKSIWKLYLDYFLNKKSAVFFEELVALIQFEKTRKEQGKRTDKLMEIVQLLSREFNMSITNNSILEELKTEIESVFSTRKIANKSLHHHPNKETKVIVNEQNKQKKDASFIDSKNKENVNKRKRGEKHSKDEVGLQKKDIDFQGEKALKNKDNFLSKLENKNKEKEPVDKVLKTTAHAESEEGKTALKAKSDLLNVKETTEEIVEPTLMEEAVFPEEKGEFYVENAGLILVHPFLKLFFENCNLLREDATIKNPELAIHLLHYLATKEEKQYENKMVFEKFLCGVSIHKSINRNVEISEELKEKTEDLLKAVITNWGSLNNASPDLLRYEFLQRSGKISFKEVNPKIVVERKVHDILLDKIPWTIGMCKLPWISKLIITDW